MSMPLRYDLRISDEGGWITHRVPPHAGFTIDRHVSICYSFYSIIDITSIMSIIKMPGIGRFGPRFLAFGVDAAAFLGRSGSCLIAATLAF